MALIFAGPSVLKWFIVSSSNGQLVPSNITVTPKIDVKISRLDFNFIEKNSKNSLSGFSRSIKLDWSLWSGRPFVELKAGSTQLTGLGIVNRFRIYTPSFDDFNYKQFTFRLEGENLEFNGSGKAASLNVTAAVNFKSFELSEIDFDLNEVNYQGFGNWTTDKLGGSLKRIDLGVALNDQPYLVEVFSQSLANEDQEIEIGNLLGTTEIKNSIIRFDLAAQNLNTRYNEGKLEDVKLFGIYNVDNGNWDSKFEFLKGVFGNNAAQVSNAVSQFNASDQELYSLDVEATVDTFDIYLSENYVGKLPSSNLEAQISVDSSFSKLNSNVKVDAEGQGLYGASKGVAVLPEEFTFFDCLYSNCVFDDFRFEHRLTLSGESVDGSSFCKTDFCDFNNLSHMVSTSNTNKLLELLQKSRIFNPLILAYLFSAISSGDKIGLGHKLNF